MAQIDPIALIEAYIPFAKSSQSLDFEKQSMMRSTAKNCTVLNSSSSNSGQSTSRTCETVERERGYETVSNANSGSTSNHVPPPYDSTGLRMIQTNYRDSSSSPRSPPARCAKRFKISSSSTSSARSSSMSSTVSALSVDVNSTNQSPKSHATTDSQHKATGKHLNNAHFVQTNDGATKLTKCFARDILHSTNNVRRLNSPPIRIDSNFDFANHNGYDDNRPSTSKSFTSGSKPVLNGAVKRRMDINANHTPTKKLESQGNRALNGKAEGKRLISENSELETRFPANNRVVFYATWEGSRVLNPDGRNVGVGLCNYSNDCFLNAVLQIILHCIPLARYLGEHLPLFSCVKDCVACGLARFIRYSMSSRQPFKPAWISFILEKAFPSHLLGAQEDAHEALNHILDALDSEARNGISSSDRNFSNPLNGSRFLTPVEQLFVGTLRNQIQCSACSAILINYERFRELNLGIKKSCYDRRLTLEDLLDDYFGSEVLNNFKCTNCKRTTQIQRSSRILRAPNLLLIQIKRFNSFGGKIGVHVNFSLRLDLQQYIHRTGESHVYELTGIVQHMGNAVEHGHYIAVVRGFDGRSYYLFDDEQRHRVSLSELHNTQAYILLYVRCDAFRNPVSPSVSLNAASEVQNDTPTRNRMMKRPYVQISMDT
ncbi:ubiquitin carboxyl-terminal hydrolase [Loa loa]|uniref:Ubiquitin carboxyl-terminal hydrolase 36 n=1 Tax=Loa loa TaxID=7209 RepID=A0A1I7VNU9_LOALO|nr:ubiquitin carboxyl-terminal hydrolase [Loa loa]EFO26482.1 ubiquitin carboxyl-terminal hydrolase [Loa loa]